MSEPTYFNGYGQRKEFPKLERGDIVGVSEEVAMLALETEVERLRSQKAVLLEAWKTVDDAYESRSELKLENAIWAMREIVEATT